MESTKKILTQQSVQLVDIHTYKQPKTQTLFSWVVKIIKSPNTFQRDQDKVRHISLFQPKLRRAMHVYSDAA